MASLLAGWLLTAAALIAALAANPANAWQPWQHFAGVFDLAGPRSDGRIVVAAGGRLFLASADGQIASFAAGPDGYQVAPGPESYLDVSPGLHVSGAGCDFARDDVYAIRPSAPLGITRVDTAGRSTTFVAISGVDTLNGIVFDRTGRFDHRLLVTAPHGQHTAILAIDCKGGIVPITNSAPAVEGGLAVAPAGFGSHAGELIAPDEVSGTVWAISAAGQTSLLVASGIAHGGDIGVESAGFIPRGFMEGGGYVYVADRGTPGNPHPGTETILRMASTDLAPLGVRDGDLLIAGEGGVATIDVRCTAACRASTIVPTATTAHGEGHLVAMANHPLATSTPLPAVSDLGSQRAQQLMHIGLALIAVVVLVALASLLFLRRRSRQRP